ncbi:MAG: hypothetical protein P1V81_03285 [Planctomycetota bacterium]|nr:hypothetical protein [Planctomycetota bacterium]
MEAPEPNDAMSWRDDLLVELVPHAVHRLGNQLTVILGTSDLLALLDKDPERREQLESVTTSAREATELVRALGAHARSGSEPVRAQDLRHLVMGAEQLFSSVAKAGGFEVAPVESSGMALVRGDGVALQLLVLGLLVSQVRPGPNGERWDGVARIRAVELGERVGLLVTTTTTDSQPLGAVEPDARAFALAASLGGRIRVRSHPGGRGRTLLLGLPVLEP